MAWSRRITSGVAVDWVAVHFSWALISRRLQLLHSVTDSAISAVNPADPTSAS